jgi:urease accessory protein
VKTLNAAFLLLADARMPTGGHAFSGGLEHACQKSVRDLASLRRFLEGRLETTGLLDAALAAAAARLEEAADFAALQDEAEARCPSPVLRELAAAQGGRLLRLARATTPTPAITHLAAATDGRPAYPLALGAMVAAAGLGPDQAALLAASAAVTGPAFAALRLLGLDPFGLAGMLGELAPAVDETAARALAGAPPGALAALPAPSAPLLEFAAEEHAHWEVRLFAS